MPDSARKFDLVIFDCDGVLVDSENLAIDALLDIISEAGLTLERRRGARHVSWPLAGVNLRDPCFRSIISL